MLYDAVVLILPSRESPQTPNRFDYSLPGPNYLILEGFDCDFLTQYN